MITISAPGAPGGPSRRAQIEYERLVGEWTANGGVPRAAEQAVTVAELVLAYRKFAATYYAPPSREAAQIRLAMRPVVGKYGHTLARNFGPLAVKGLQLGRSAAKEPAAVKPVSDAMFEATLTEIGSPQVRSMLQLIRLTGARPGEVCIMRTCDIDRTASPWKYVPQSHKTAYKGHERVIYIGPRAQVVLADWLRADREVNSLPLSLRMWSGTPRRTNRSLSRSSTSSLVNLRATSIARHSRVNSSTIVSIRNARPSDVLSMTKS